MYLAWLGLVLSERQFWVLYFTLPCFYFCSYLPAPSLDYLCRYIILERVCESEKED